MLELEAQTLYAVLIRLAMAALMGGVIGLERERPVAAPPCAPICSSAWARR